MKNYEFIVVGSGGGGATVAWVLAKAGFRVALLEQGADMSRMVRTSEKTFNPEMHDEYRFRIERPDPKRRPRGDYNTFRTDARYSAIPLGKLGGWTGTALGGGSLLWGAWALRALPVDLRLGTLYRELGIDAELKSQGYNVQDWPISHAELEPYFDVAETFLAVSGNRDVTTKAINQTQWFKEFSGLAAFKNSGNWNPKLPFPLPPYTTTPVGELFAWMAKNGKNPTSLTPLPTAIVSPSANSYSTRAQLAKVLKDWSADKPGFWQSGAETLWSERVRDACNLCGFCGEYVCWGGRSPKSGGAASTLPELSDLPEVADVITAAKAYEITYDERTRRAKGVRYLDTSDPDAPKEVTLAADNVIVSCGAIQTARLLLMSGQPTGLGNSSGCVGRFCTFHLFGLGATCVLPEKFQGYLHGEFGHTGTLVSFDHYFMKDDVSDRWVKGGIITSIAKKNPMEVADSLVRGGLSGEKLLQKMELNSRTVELRYTGDDLPHYSNIVDLDPNCVDEYGFPVARITRRLGPQEDLMYKLASKRMRDLFAPLSSHGVNLDDPAVFNTAPAQVDLFGDHQMGTCRMGENPAESVVDRYCRLHDVKNVFVLDTSFMPSGMGLNPMVTTVANALRVGTWIVEEHRKGRSFN
jgi:choline dehydrogenase-like flavoprotein